MSLLSNLSRRRTNRSASRRRQSHAAVAADVLEERLLLSGINVAQSTFSVDQFEQNIIDFLDGNVVGYGYAINQNGALAAHGSGGIARREIDTGIVGLEVGFETDTRIEIASTSKTITAVAMLKLLDDQNISVDEKIYSYLPTAWQDNLGPLIELISFSDLLKQRSGIRAESVSTHVPDRSAFLRYDHIGGVLADGIDLFEYGLFEYNNINYALQRILIPYVWDDVPNSLLEGDGVDAAAATGAWYKYYVQTNVLGPMGISGADMAPPVELYPALTYLAVGDGQPGYLWGDSTEVGGAHGWKLSADDLAKFLDGIDGPDAVLSQATIDLMRDEFFGLHDPQDREAEGWYGTYFGHGGDIFNEYGEAHSTAFTFPGGIQAAVIMNSAPGFNLHQNSRLQDAYEDAWTDVVIDGTSAQDTFTVRSLGNDVVVTLNGERVLRQRAATLHSLTLNGFGSADTFDVRRLANSAEEAVILTINGHSGGDTVVIESASEFDEYYINTHGENDTVELTPGAAGAGENTLDAITGIIHLDMGEGTSDEILIDDRKFLAPTGVPDDNRYDIWSDRFDSDGFGHLNFENAERVELRANDGNNQINVRGIDRNVRLTVFAGAGNDNIVAGYGTGDLDTYLRGDLVVRAGEDHDRLQFNDGSDNIGNDSYSFGFGSFTKTGLQNWDYLQTEEVVLNASSFNNTINVSSLGPVDLTINALAGDDTINIGSGRAEFVRGDVHVNGSVGADVININDQNAPVPRIYTLAGQTFDMSSPIFGSLSYTTISDVVLNAGNSGDTINLESSVLSTAIELLGNGGDDTFNIGNGDVGAVGGSVIARGGADHDVINVLDQDDVGDDDYTVTDNSVSKPGFFVQYNSMEELHLFANADRNRIDVEDTRESTPVWISGGGGPDRIHLAPTTRNLSSISGAVYVDGQGGRDRLILHDEDNPNRARYTITPDSVNRFFFGPLFGGEPGVRFDDVELVRLLMTADDDVVNINGTNPGTEYDLRGRRGNDTFNVNVPPLSPVTLRGGNGFDTANIFGTNADDEVSVSAGLGNADVNLVSIENASFDGLGGTDVLVFQGMAGVNEHVEVHASTSSHHGRLIIIAEDVQSEALNLLFEDTEILDLIANPEDNDTATFSGTAQRDRFEIDLAADGTSTDPVLQLFGPATTAPLLSLRDYRNFGTLNVSSGDGADEFNVYVAPTGPGNGRNLSLDGGSTSGGNSGRDALTVFVQRPPRPLFNHDRNIQNNSGAFDIDYGGLHRFFIEYADIERVRARSANAGN